MTQLEAIHARHSVRQYQKKAIPDDIRAELGSCAENCAREGNISIRILYDEPECFSSRMAHYGRFENADNYIVLAGKKAPDLDERCGYYGEKVVLRAQQLGLNTCWVALTHGKSKAVLAPDEKEVIIISLGYGKTPGSSRKSKRAENVSSIAPDSPQWFRDGVEAALLAPTAVNQQKFRFTLEGDRVRAKTVGIGSCLKIDLGIVKCHFEIGSGKDSSVWL